MLAAVVRPDCPTDLDQIPATFDPGSYGLAMLVVIGAAVISGLLVKRDLDRLDLVEALKTGG